MANAYENGIFGLIPEEEWLNVGFNVTRQNDPIDTLFGDEKTDNMIARWQTIAHEYQVPMMAQFHGFDTEAQTTFRVPVDNHNIEKGLIKVKINQSELMREYIKSGVRNEQMADYIINDGVRLAEQVFTRTKVAKNELMATGKVTIHENNLNETVDYGVPAANIAYTIDVAQDIFAQIQAIIDDATAKGITINGMMTSKANLTKFRNSASVQKVINGTAGVGAIVTRAAFEDFLETEFGIERVITNDLTYGASSTIDTTTGRPVITSKRYYPANKVTFFATNPSGRLGVGLWGNPPEVDINGLGAKVSAESGVSPYVYVTQYAEKDPAVLWTKASGLFMPVLYNPDSLFVATVTNTGA
jgi:hypothetical protein